MCTVFETLSFNSETLKRSLLLLVLLGLLALALLILTTRLIMHVAVCLLDLALVVDCSVTPGVNYTYVKEFMVNIISSIDINKEKTRVGAVSFGTQLKRYWLSLCCRHSTVCIDFVELSADGRPVETAQCL